ncbi:MAG TPA: ABC transporter ATP-binding protein [Planctomycetota bacterium]|nr:ABC transporter ATP-binding protein [Planctomycetota bacterium]
MARELAIEVHGVTKRFKRFRTIQSHTTLKMALVEWLRSWRAARDRLSDPNRFDVVKGIDVEIERGECVGLIGRNGAGKSTLLKMLAGIYRPDAGTIRVNGRVAALIELGAGFHPEFTGRENIYLNGIILGLSKRQVQERFDEIVEFSEIEEFIDAPTRTYSSGMFMRLAFSVAIHVDPDILLIDEVLGVGDEAFQAKCRRAIEQRIRERRQTTLIVSHDLRVIEQLCNRVVLIDPPDARVFADPKAAIAEFRRIQAEHEAAVAAHAAQHHASQPPPAPPPV